MATWTLSIKCYNCSKEVEFDDDFFSSGRSLDENEDRAKRSLREEDGWYSDDDGDIFCDECRSEFDGSSDDDEDDDESSNDGEAVATDGLAGRMKRVFTYAELSRMAEIVRDKGIKAEVIFGYKTRAGLLTDGLVCPSDGIEWANLVYEACKERYELDCDGFPKETAMGYECDLYSTPGKPIYVLYRS